MPRNRERDILGRRRAAKLEELRRTFTVRLPEFGGLTQYEMERLATYNTEMDRGLMHTPEYKEEMRKLQEIFDRAARESEINDK
jgi:hypothetical protein